MLSLPEINGRLKARAASLITSLARTKRHNLRSPRGLLAAGMGSGQEKLSSKPAVSKRTPPNHSAAKRFIKRINCIFHNIFTPRRQAMSENKSRIVNFVNLNSRGITWRILSATRKGDFQRSPLNLVIKTPNHTLARTQMLTGQHARKIQPTHQPPAPATSVLRLPATHARDRCSNQLLTIILDIFRRVNPREF